MNTVNHAAVGALIGLSINPVLAVSSAFLSHFVLDALPHFGFKGHGGYGEAFKHKTLVYPFLAFDLAGIVVLAYLLSGRPLIVLVCAFIAILPDLFWLYRYFGFERKGLEPPGSNSMIVMIHRRIQWFERPIGFVVEVIFAATALTVVWRLA